ncbi:MAG TPA: ParB/RepB/Spo0J family partition protein [Spirochaetota bacterium]|nr:ParB/RepB/Spo0J family partition protein [Spirochaetota bacterium]
MESVFGAVRPVSLAGVDFLNATYRVSRKRPIEGLVRSIECFGLLESPVFLREAGRLVPVFGHNRLAALVRAGIETFDAAVVDEIDPAAYRARAVLKCSRNEAGPVGRMRMAEILRMLGLGEAELSRTVRHGLEIPVEFASAETAGSVMRLPRRLRDYIDLRDIGFKVIKGLLGLPAEAHEFLAGRVDDAGIRVNVFRDVVEMMSDILRRDGTLAPVLALPAPETGDRRRDEQLLHDAVYSLRYPAYSEMKENAGQISAEIERGGCSVSIPPYFEGGGVSLTIRFGRGDDEDSIRGRLSGIDARKIEKLIGLL